MTGGGLSHVTVKKTELILRLTANWEAHQADYEEAERKYRAAAIEQLHQMLEAAERGDRFDTMIVAPKPSYHSDDYERIIDMVRMSVEETVELTQQEFSQYVRDDWGWKQNFTQTASFYKQ